MVFTAVLQMNLGRIDISIYQIFPVHEYSMLIQISFELFGHTIIISFILSLLFCITGETFSLSPSSWGSCECCVTLSRLRPLGSSCYWAYSMVLLWEIPGFCQMTFHSYLELVCSLLFIPSVWNTVPFFSLNVISPFWYVSYLTMDKHFICL